MVSFLPPRSWMAPQAVSNSEMTAISLALRLSLVFIVLLQCLADPARRDNAQPDRLLTRHALRLTSPRSGSRNPAACSAHRPAEFRPRVGPRSRGRWPRIA